MNHVETAASSEMIDDVVPHCKVKVLEAHTTVAISVKFTAQQKKNIKFSIKTTTSVTQMPNSVTQQC